jgi:hypothetical protein
MYEELFEKLNSGKVRFLLLGGAAVSLHGFPRMTTDIDILLENSRENIAHLLEVLRRWGNGCAADLVYEDFQGPGAIRVIEHFPLDIFTLVDGRGFEAFAGRAANYSLAEGIDVPCLSIDDLIAVKRRTMREKDQLDVAELRRLQARSQPLDGPRTIPLDLGPDQKG